MRAFLRQVEAAAGRGEFQRPPLGPLGSLLALEDDKWAGAVEVRLPILVSPTPLASTIAPAQRPLQPAPAS